MERLSSLAKATHVSIMELSLNRDLSLQSPSFLPLSPCVRQAVTGLLSGLALMGAPEATAK